MVREALIEVRGQTKDPVIKIEAQSLSEEVGSYRFTICVVVWYDIFFVVVENSVYSVLHTGQHKTI